MSDTNHCSTRNISALVEEIIAKRPPADPFKPSHYAGAKASKRAKYSTCEYVRTRAMSIRKLSQREINELQAHVGRCMEGRDA